MKRYEKTDYNYPTYYTVECPECKNEGMVECQKGYYESTFHCPNCFEKKKLSDNIRYKAYVKRHCPGCGKQVQAEQANLRTAPETLKICCPYCSEQFEYSTNTEKYLLKNETKGLKGDPYFGFPLYFQTEVKRHLFWAYNREHLNEIRVYVEAGLRERQTTYARTMVAWLPQFIKDAKNRTDILKAIDRMLHNKK